MSRLGADCAVAGYRFCRRRRWSKPRHSGKRAASRKPTTCSARWWPSIPTTPITRCAGAGCYLDHSQPADAVDLFNEALELKKDHAGALLGLALVAAEDFESVAAELAHKALALDPKLAGGPGTAGAAGARGQRHSQGGRQRRTRPSPSTPSRSKAEPSWPLSTGWLTRRTQPSTPTPPAATRPPATFSSSTAATKRAFSITARPSSSIRNCTARARNWAST